MVSFSMYKSQPDDPCYNICTSGSTGKPKGVLVAHRGVSYIVFLFLFYYLAVLLFFFSFVVCLLFLTYTQDEQYD